MKYHSKIRVVLQARTDSQRLSGKSMMLVSGFPLAVLAGLRAANTGLEVVIATTSRSIDDLLAEAVDSAGLLVYRGESANVRQRIIDSCEDLTDDAILVRLTGDNVFPDGDLIDEVLKFFINTNQIFTSTIACQIPYGVAVEVVRLGTLKKSLDWGRTKFDSEHVTSSISNNVPHVSPPVKHPAGNLSEFRCTVDTQKDFETVRNLFSKVESPITVSWRTLVSLLINQTEINN
jgi:spore coat polysaccharide biosynthesis protein SpsF